MSVTWSPQTMRDGTRCVSLHVLQRHHRVLNAITSTLTELGVSVYRVSAFCTDTGIALDSFELSHFDQTSADVIVKRLQMLESNTSRTRTSRVLFTGIDELARHMPADYSTSTTAANRLKHLELYRQLNEDGDNGERVVISWELKPDGDDSHNVLIHLAFRDGLGSLGDLVDACGARHQPDQSVGLLDRHGRRHRHAGGEYLDQLGSRAQGAAPEPHQRAGGRGRGADVARRQRHRVPSDLARHHGRQARSHGRGRHRARLVCDRPDDPGAGDLAFLKEDFDGATLHLGFVHKRRNHSIAITFPGGAAHQERALTLLARFRPWEIGLHYQP